MHAADRLVNVLSHWLARHVTSEELRREVEGLESAALSPGQAEAVDELLAELRDPNGHSGELEMVVRETIQALCFEI